MPNAEYAKLEYEAGQTAYAQTALTDQGDHLDYDSAVNLFSRKSGSAPAVRPDGIRTGGAVTAAASGSNDVVDTTALTSYIAGASVDVAAKTDKALTRADGTPGDYRKNSITVTAAGSIAVVVGTEGTAFSTTRGAAGGPPWIPTTSIEIAQVELNSTAAAAVAASEIKQVPNVSCEWYNNPIWDVDYSDVSNNVLGNAGVTFKSALMVAHSDDAGTNSSTKKVYAAFSTPSFTEVPDAYDFVPPANSHSVSSTQVYNRTVGAVSSSIGAGAFSCLLQDGVTDAFLAEIDEYLWFRFYQNRNNDPYVLANGKLGMTRSFPAGDNIVATCSLGAHNVADNIAG